MADPKGQADKRTSGQADLRTCGQNTRVSIGAKSPAHFLTLMDMPFDITLLMVMAMIAGISAQVLAAYMKVPSIVFLLLFGILLGPDGCGVLHPQLLGDGLESIVSLAVALILFEGGLKLEIRELGKV